MNLRLFDSLATTEPLADVFSDASMIAAMLRFEASLARVEAELGQIPASAAAAIERSADPAAFDSSAIARAARSSGTITQPLVEMLTARVRDADPGAATFVHWGATSQDVSDTALVLCLARAAEALTQDHARLTNSLRRSSENHAATVMLARTLMQPAPPITFGLKAAGWYGAVSRSGAHLLVALRDACVLQFGGASGTLAFLGSQGPAVAAALARELDLPLPDAPWHSQRDRLATLVSSCGVYVGSLGKIARDVSLLMQFEVAEAAEPGGGSSTMPHKRNPAGCAVALAAATRVPGLVASFLSGMPQEHERGLGNWHAEATTVVSVVQSSGAALAAITDVIETLRVDAARMRTNIAATGGLVFAERVMMLLAPKLGRDMAGRHIKDAMQAADRDHQPFLTALAAIPEVSAALSATELISLDSPEAYLGSAEEFRRRLLHGK
jgi:3-carboxy-cis,cis-muconate cycloisomerase